MNLRQAISRFRPQRRRLLVIGVCTVLGAIAEAIGLVLVVALAQAVATSTPEFSSKLGPLSLHLPLGQLAALAFAAIFISTSLTLLVNALQVRLSTTWTLGARDEVVNRFLAADWSHQAEYRQGNVGTLVSYMQQGGAILQAIATGARGLFGVLVLLITAIVISPIGAVGILVVGVVLFAVLRPLTMAVRRRNRQLAELQWRYNEAIAELSELTRDIRVFGAEDEFSSRLHGRNVEVAGLERQVGTLSGSLAPVYQGIALLLVVLVLWFAGGRSGDIAVIGAVALLLLRSVSYGQMLQTSYNQVHNAIPPLEEGDRLLVSMQGATTPEGSLDLDRIRTVQLAGVSFTYPDGTPALRDVDMDLRFGEIVGVVGPSGSGKSTLAQLLLRLREPDEGAVLANGVPISDYRRSAWYGQVGLVPQQSHLIHASAFDNIAFFRPTVTADDVQWAARAAGIDETIAALPEGFDTMVGETMRNLSGGQIQRVGIARAIVGHPSMLVLDEPTSALDQNSEAVVQEALDALREHALIVVIAHRLSTLSICDLVVVMNDGTVEAAGTLSEALEASPFFREAFERGALPSG